MKKKLLISAFFLCAGLLSVRAQVIEDFETGLASAAGLTFRNQNSSSFSILDCNVSPLFGSSISPSFANYNLPAQKASIVTQGVWEPILLGYGIFQDVVGPNGNKHAIRLNDVNSGGYDISSFQKKFVPTNPYVSFDYMVAMDASHVNNIPIQPFFTARLLDDQGNLIPSTQFCIMADPAEPLLMNVDDHLFFSKGWYCGMLIMPEEYVGQTVFVQFISADCGAGGHLGVAYVDNIVNGRKCEKPQYGFIDLKPVKTEGCSPKEVKVCGTFSAPQSSTLTSLDLEILQNGIPVSVPPGFINVIYQSGNDFCFLVDFAGMGISFSGDYEFRVVATFTSTINGYVYTLTDTSSNVGPDVSFGGGAPIVPFVDFSADTISWPAVGGPYYFEFVSDGQCCPNRASIQPPNGITGTIVTNNTSMSFYDPIVLLQTKCLRFRMRTACSKWTEWCCITSYGEQEGGYTLGAPGESFDCEGELDLDDFGSGRPVAYPTPTNGKVNVKNAGATSFEVYDMTNNMVLSKKMPEIQENVELDLHGLKPGIYILKTDKNHSIKLIKN